MSKNRLRATAGLGPTYKYPTCAFAGKINLQLLCHEHPAMHKDEAARAAPTAAAAATESPWMGNVSVGQEN